MALDATIGGASANSYVTMAAAQAYFDDRLDMADWEQAVAADTAEPALLMACTILEGERYEGTRVTTTQALSWPRAYVYLPDKTTPESSATIPTLVQAAQCELALALLKDPEVLSATGLEGFTSLQLGALAVTPRATTAIGLPPLVRRLLRPVLVPGTPVVRA